MKQLSMFEEGIVVSAKKLVSLTMEVKNLKKQMKELYESYLSSKSAGIAKQIVDIMVSLDDLKDDLKSARKDIDTNVEELAKKPESEDEPK